MTIALCKTLGIFSTVCYMWFLYTYDRFNTRTIDIRMKFSGFYVVGTKYVKFERPGYEIFHFPDKACRDNKLCWGQRMYFFHLKLFTFNHIE